MLKNMKIEKGTAFVISDEKQRFYFTGFKSTFGYLVISEKESVFFTDKRYLVGAKARLNGTEIKLKEACDFCEVQKYIAEKKFAKLGVDFAVTFMTDYKEYEKCGLEIFDINGILAETMSIKSDSELSIMRKSCKIAQESFYEVIKMLKVGVTEKEVATEFEHIMKKKGAEAVSFDLIIAFGENAAIPHHETDDTKLKANECVLMDFGCLYKGYCSDMTRTLFFGTPDEKFVKDYNAVLKSAEIATLNIKDGMTGIEADALARDYLGQQGIATYFTHSLGHGIGVNIHEFPRLSPKASNVLKNNMVFSIEPGVYFEGSYGIRIEDTVALINGKVERFMTDDKNLLIVNI